MCLVYTLLNHLKKSEKAAFIKHKKRVQEKLTLTSHWNTIFPIVFLSELIF